MKKVITLLCFCALNASALFAQEDNYLPESVFSAFNAEHLLVKSANWFLGGSDVYKVEYTLFGDKRVHTAKYDPQGNRVEKQTPIDYTQLPDKAKTEIARLFKDYAPALCSMQLMLNNDIPDYKVTVERWSFGRVFRQSYNLLLSAQGELLEKSDLELEFPESLLQEESILN